MRIGALVPRMNGVGYLGATPECAPYDITVQLQLLLQDALNSLGYGIEQGTAVTPSDFQTSLTSQAQMLCSGTSFGCGTDRCAVPYDLISSLVGQYSTAYSQMLNQKLQEVANGDICSPVLAARVQLTARAYTACGYGGAPPTTVPQGSAQNQYTYQSPNALDRTAPTVSTVTPAPPVSVLNPPQLPPPLQMPVGSPGSTNLGMRPGNAAPVQKSDCSFWQTYVPAGTILAPDTPGGAGGMAMVGFCQDTIPVWVLLAGGAGLLFLFMSGKGR